jgi:uncharacterized protein (TIGR03437 family)
VSDVWKCLPLLLAAGALISTRGSGAGPSTTLIHLSNTGVRAVKVDASGNIYIAGYQGLAGDSNTWDAFVAKLSPDGSKILYSTTFAGSSIDVALALDIDSTGAAYILGDTLSADFPVTPGALQTTAPANTGAVFVAKVDAQGKVVYAALLGGTSTVQPGPGSLVVNAAGEAIVSGYGGNFPSSPSAPFTSTSADFVLKLDATGSKLLAVVRGVRGRIATDDQGSIYIAGFQLDAPSPIPLTPGAFQSTHRFNLCFGTGQLPSGCPYQYVTKLNAGLTQLVYSTYVTGSWGATPVEISVDAQRNVLLAGSTNSPDYPTSSSAYEPVYIANAAHSLVTLFTCLGGCISQSVPPASGYVTKLNATGTGLVYSTFFSGTQADTITFAAVTSGGTLLSGEARSPDLPGFEAVPAQCIPQTFQARLSPDGSEVGASHIVAADVLAYDPVTGTLLSWTGTDLIRFDPAAPSGAIACIMDAADLRQVTAIAPGELLSIFGPHFLNEREGPPPGRFLTSLGGVAVTFNGIAGPLLYVSPEQINVQVPYEIANSPQASLILTSSEMNLSDSRTLPVIARNPVAFLDTVTPLAVAIAGCEMDVSFYGVGPFPLAFNSDGSRNTCSNPARSGSVVRIFLAGLGVTVPTPVAGSINPNPGIPLNLAVTIGNGSAATVVSATAVPGSISGVWEVDVRLLPSLVIGMISLVVDSVPVRDTNLTIWQRP